MTDNRNKIQRSYCMSQIKSKDTTPELIVRKHLHKNGFRYSLHSKKLPGKPDIVLKKHKTVIFINGCFWHGHLKCPDAKTPNSNQNFWNEKIIKNRYRDKNNITALKKLNWRVITVWECQLKRKSIIKTLNKLVEKLH